MREIILLMLLSFGVWSCRPAGSGEMHSQNAVPATTPASAMPAAMERPADVTIAFDRDYLMGRFDPSVHPDFIGVDPKFANRAGHYLRKDAYEAFRRMYAAAAAEGIALTILSATRNFESQKGIWEAKWTGTRLLSDGENAAVAYADPVARARKILEYSSMPGSSRHHWGTDIDLISLNNAHFDTGAGKKAYDWLRAHASTYGFCQPYSAGRPAGYNEERWHWSYLPVARQLTQLAGSSLKDEEITGFLGAETAGQLHIVEYYILGINPECLDN